MIKLIAFILIILQCSFAEVLFPVDENLKKRVNFWKKVYTESSTQEGFLHDENDLSVIYEKVNLKGLSEKEITKKIKEKRSRWADVIQSIYKKKIALTRNEEEIIERIKRFPHRKLKEMATKIRFQLGLSDRYFHGLQESYKYLDEIKQEFRALGLPEELAFLPHVESSFNYKAYSKVGAAGIWQFMAPTARLYKLKRDYLVDERRDPLISTRAAAKLLKDNYKRFKSWPLAITAYNAGPNGLARAIIKTGSRDLSEILEKYDRGRFGFASKNFYATFMAANEVSQKPQIYFKNIRKRSHPPFKIIKVSKETKISDLAKTYKLDLDELENCNLALRPVVFKRNMSIPKGYLLKIPDGDRKIAITEIAKTTPTPKKPATKKKSLRAIASLKDLKKEKNLYKIKVEPDETLGHYADWSLVPQEKILELNKNLKKSINLGLEISIPIEGPNLDRFIKKRSEYHARIQESYFNKFRVDGVMAYQIKKGDTLEKLTGKLEIPLWLIKKYHKDLKLNKLKVGDTLELPKIVSVSDYNKSPSMQNQ